MRAACLALALVVGGGLAHAQDSRELARQHWRAGEAKFRAGDYRAAMLELAAADALAPSSILSYDIAVCHERLGENDEAAARYREYLTRRPDAPNRRAVEERIARLGGGAPRGPAPPRPPDTDDGLSEPRSIEGAAPPPAGGQRPDDFFSRRVPDRRGAAVPPPPETSAPEPGAPTGEPPAAPLAPPEPPRRGSTPVYKQWWFWVVVGVGAIIVIDVAASSSDRDSTTRALAPKGLTLIRF
jgi:tetratricopeptide (TPR) repeat protein